MTDSTLPIITGLGSVSPWGTLAGLIPPSPVAPSLITSWPTDGPRRAFLVEPFQPSSVIPGLKTRRLDRLSAWSLVAASLALQDAGVDLAAMDRTRLAVVFGTGSGCIELTEAFYQSAGKNGWAGTDPITFPETLANSPAGHVALFHDLRGPNITVSCKGFAGESALLQASALLRLGQADLVVVIAGDTLTQTMYEWYETARMLSPACRSEEAAPDAKGHIPSEGVVAMVLELEGNRTARRYGRLRAGRWAAGGEPEVRVRRMLGDVAPRLTIAAGDGAPCGASDTAASSFLGMETVVIPGNPAALGIPDAGGLLHLVLALSGGHEPGPALMLATSRDSGFAAMLLDLF